MPKNRVIYQSESLYAGPSPATGFHFNGGYATGNVISGLVKELHRVQSINYDFSIPKQDVNQFNQLAAIDRVSIDPPVVSLDFNYLLADLSNEKYLGFDISSGVLGMTSCISGILTKASDEKNYFIRTTPEGTDEAGYVEDGNSVVPSSRISSVIGIGNGFVTSYSVEGSVGAFPTASVRVEALNMDFRTGVYNNQIPAINPVDGSEITNVFYSLPTGVTSPTGFGSSAISVLRPGDIVVDLGGFNEGGADINDWKAQSFSVSFDLGRQDLRKLGNKYAFSKEITFPVSVQMSVTADMGDLKTGNLTQILSNDNTYNLGVKIYRPNTVTRNDHNVAAYYLLRGAELNSQSFSSSIGSNKSVTLNFSSQLGSPTQTGLGLSISGIWAV